MTSTATRKPRERRRLPDPLARFYRFVGSEHSGRFDRDPSLLLRVRNWFMRDGSIALYTEVTAGPRRAALRHGERRWGTLQVVRKGQPDLSETAIQYRRFQWKVVEWDTVVLGPDLGPGGRVVMTYAVLENRFFGFRIVVSVWHGPASIEADVRDGRDTRRTDTSYDAQRRMDQLVDRLCEKHDALGILTGDWNLRAAGPALAFADRAMPRSKIARPIPNDASHAGGRLIDWIRKNVRHLKGWRVDRLGWRVLKRTRASDHRSIRFWVRLRRIGKATR